MRLMCPTCGAVPLTRGQVYQSWLQRHVYGRPLELKRTKALREVVLSLLDIPVESGSSAAFRMRDDFVTPAN